MTEPQLVINWGAVGVSAVLCFVFGGLWYGPICGKAWAAGMGFDMSKKPDPAVMKKAFLLQAIGVCLLVYVFAHVVQVWRPSVWGGGADQPDYVYALMGAFFTWIGFYVPQQLAKVAWESRPWKVFVINVGHDFVQLLMVGTVLSYWR